MSNWVSTTTFQRHRLPLSLLAMAGTVGIAWLSFLHLMQSSPAFAEAVARVSPDIANRFSCTCPYCLPVCQPEGMVMGIERFDNFKL